MNIEDYDFSRLEKRFSKGITDFPLENSFQSTLKDFIFVTKTLQENKDLVVKVEGDLCIFCREFAIMQKTYKDFCSKFFSNKYLNFSFNQFRKSKFGSI